MLDEKLALAYHWDLWALAYMAQGGCSDDGFRDFRAWLILQGKELFEAALQDIHQVYRRIPAGLETSAEGLRSAAAVPYQARTSQAMPLAKGGVEKLRGTKWEEEDLPGRYPEIFR